MILTAKKIAVIGTGASAIQFVPQIQPLASELIIFQRTAPWSYLNLISHWVKKASS